MSDSMRERLETTQRKLDLVLEIDRIRDTAPDPSAMLIAIVDLMAETLQADLCLLCLFDRETGDLELKAVNDTAQQFGALDQTVVKRLQSVKSAAIWQGDQVPAALRAGGNESQVAVVPIVLREDQRLGVLLLSRTAPPFTPTDLELLRVAESQIDSAVVQGYAYHDLEQRNKELETIYRVDRIRDQQLPFDEMLNAVLHTLRDVIQAEVGFVMLYNRRGQQLELRATTHDDLFRVSAHYETINRVANQALQRAEMVCYNDLGERLRSLLCIPLILRNEIIGVLGVANRYGPSGFTEDDQRLLYAIGSQMDTAIFESLEQRRLRQVLGRSVDPRVMERLLANQDTDFLKGERMVLTVLYADIRGSTKLAERTTPESLVRFINAYLGRMTEIILAHEGTLDKFVGDEVMALFGAPFPQADHALRAVRVGLEMQKAHAALMASWRENGLVPAPIGVGIATGEMIVGEMGSPQRTDYTVIGRAANLGSRICGVAQAGQVLISEATFELVGDRVQARPISGLHLKGVDRPVTVYHVTGLTA